MKKFICLLMMLMTISFAAEAKEVNVIDGDSIVVDGVEMRLEGIDAPEYKQFCYDKNEKKYPCGKRATEYMKSLVSSDIKCRKITIDKYRRQVSVCYVHGEDINKKMVAAGWAVAYSRYTHDYDKVQAEAKKEKRGIWKGRFIPPELYRRLNN